MGKKDICLIIQGKDRGIAWEKIKSIFFDEFGHGMENIIINSSIDDEKRKSGEVIAGVSLALAIPGAVLAVKELYERSQRKKQIDNFLLNLEKHVIFEKEVSVKIEYPDGTIKNVSKKESAKILDELS